MLERFDGETIPSEQDVHEEMARDAEPDTRIKDMADKIGKKFRLSGPKKYFELKYGNAYPVIEIREEMDFHKASVPPAFLYIGRVLTEGKPELLRGKTYYGYIEGTGEGEFVHESELATLVTDIIPGGIDRFHAHLHECQQCRDHPFDLCPTGARLLKAAAEKPF